MSSVEDVRKEQSLKTRMVATLMKLLCLVCWTRDISALKIWGDIHFCSSVPKLVTENEPVHPPPKGSGGQRWLLSGLHCLFRAQKNGGWICPRWVWLGKIFNFISRACATGTIMKQFLWTYHMSQGMNLQMLFVQVTMSNIYGHVAKLFTICPPGSVLHPFSLLVCALGGLLPPSAAIRLPCPLVSGWFSQWEHQISLRAGVGGPLCCGARILAVDIFHDSSSAGSPVDFV